MSTPNQESFKPPRKKLPKELAVIDADRCTGCEACMEVCPVDCIAKVRPDSGLPGLSRWCEIDWDRCIGCRLCIRIPRKRLDAYQLLVCAWEAIEMVPIERLADAAVQMGGPPEYAEGSRPRLLALARRQADLAGRG